MRLLLAIAACAILLGPVASAAAPKQAPAGPRIAITFDDIPAHGPLPPGVTRLEIAQRIIAALQAHHVPAFGFFNGSFGADNPDSPKVVAAWRDAGFPLGNHSFSHRNLNQTETAKFEADVARNEPLLKRANGKTDWHWFRFPFLAEGKDAAQIAAYRGWMRSRGYRIAAVTMSFDDYAWNAPFARCRAAGDDAAVAELQRSYLDAAREDARRARILSLESQGRDIPYVLLMHLGAFDAQMLPKLLAMYEAEGFTFVSLPQAEADRFYRSATDLSQPGPSPSLAAAAQAAGKPVPSVAHRLDTLDKMCR